MTWLFVSPLVCKSCTEPIPLCMDGEFLTVDLNTTHFCCPQYYCGKCILTNLKYFDVSKVIKILRCLRGLVNCCIRSFPGLFTWCDVLVLPLLIKKHEWFFFILINLWQYHSERAITGELRVHLWLNCSRLNVDNKIWQLNAIYLYLCDFSF